MRHFHLFAYGTLLDRERSPARELLQDCERVGEATVHGSLYDAGDYPALVLDGTEPVPGVIWRCPAEILPRLDRYEAAEQRLFRRVGMRIDGVACWLYVAGPRLGEHLLSERRLRTRAKAEGG
jgi:gamma-glutamylcyclotransferase (GGCT)/AIG2-like uncharacterized protein YtfP